MDLKPIKFFLLSVFLLAPLLSCVSTPRQKNADVIKQEEALRDLGKAYMVEKKYTIALRELLKAEKLYADDPILQDYIGLCYREKGNYDAAVRHFKKAVDIKPDYAVARNNLGVTYLLMEDWDSAIQIFQQLVTSEYLDIYTTPHYPLVNLGLAYYMQGEYAQAESYYRETLAYFADGFPRDQVYIRAQIGLGRTLLAAGQTDKALEVFVSLTQELEEHIGIHPKLAKGYLPRGYYELAEAYAAVGRTAAAKEYYAKAAALLPDTELGRTAKKKAEALP
jgi:type IV pilus assembly protein PilF